MLVGLALLIAAQATQNPAPAETSPMPSTDATRSAIVRAVDYLVRTQHADGSWGSAANATYTDLWSNPYTHEGWIAGTTGLACMALLRVEAKPEREIALEKGLAWLCAHADLRRAMEWDIDNVWGHVYALQACSLALADSRRFTSPDLRTQMKATAEHHVARMVGYQTAIGGWGYYTNPDANWVAEWATSFLSASTVLAFVDARAAGISVPETSLDRACESIRHCRLPTGSYTYSVSAISSPGRDTGIDQVKSALGRIQSCNLALWRAKGEIDEAQRIEGLELFFRYQRFLECGRRRPIPHESYYAVAGYFYFFGQYHAAEIIATLPREKRMEYAGKLRKQVLLTQEADGSMWDYYLHDYGRPYGTAYGILTLLRTLPDAG